MMGTSRRTSNSWASPPRARPCTREFPEMARRVVYFSGAVGWSGPAGHDAQGQPVIAKGLEPAELIRELDRLIRQLLAANSGA